MNFPNVSLLQRVEAQGSAAVPSTPARGDRSSRLPGDRPAEAAAQATRKHEAALSLIAEVSTTIPLLIQQNDELKGTILELKRRSDEELKSATMIAYEWRKAAESAKQKCDHLEVKLAEALRRAERAEGELAAERHMSQVKSKEAAEAECLSSLFEDKVISSFGEGSPFQTALERIRNRAETAWG